MLARYDALVVMSSLTRGCHIRVLVFTAKDILFDQ